MNERIRELAEKAGSTHKQNLGVYQFYTDELEKFAHGIIREYLSTLCVNIDKHNVDLSNLPTWYKVMTETDKHFGVEDE
jgi:hypothetical protein